jgi:hypothetical protein
MALNILNMEIHDLFDQFTEQIEGHVEQNQWEQRLTIPSHIGKEALHVRVFVQVWRSCIRT